MNITNFASIPNITSQITTSAATASRNCFSQPLSQLDLSNRKGYQTDYSVRDAAESLWRQETQTFHIRDLDDPEKAGEILENARMCARWDLGREQGVGETKDEVISNYIQNLRQNGLDGSVDWNGLARELDGFKTMTPEELSDGLDYLASRYAAVLDKLERNYSGEELTAQRAKLEEVYQAGKSVMIDNYTRLLQDNLGLSDGDAQAVKDSFSQILSEKQAAYQNALKKVGETVSQTGADSVWLKNHDAYIASQLRAAGSASSASSASSAKQSEARFSVQDLTAAGKIALDYRREIFNAGGQDEVSLAFHLSMADMKAETMIQNGLVSQNMAALLRNSRAQGHENALNALNQALAKRENNRAPGEPKGTFAPVAREVFQGIYQAVLNAYRQNGGDAAEAVRARVSIGKSLTAQAAAENPKAFRWGVSMECYWKNFYKTPETKNASPLEIQVNKLMAQIGQSDNSGCSTYQKYVNEWQEFLASVGGGINTLA